MPVKNKVPVFAIVMLVVLFSSCQYYKVTTLAGKDASQTAAKLDSFYAANRYAILRNGHDEAYQITDLKISNDQTTAAMLLKPVDEAHRFYLTEGANSSKRYRRARPTQKEIVHEVHVYTPHDSAAKAGSYSLKLDNVQRIDILNHNKKRTANSYVLSGIGLTVAAAAIALGILLATWPAN